VWGGGWGGPVVVYPFLPFFVYAYARFPPLPLLNYPFVSRFYTFATRISAMALCAYPAGFV